MKDRGIPIYCVCPDVMEKLTLSQVVEMSNISFDYITEGPTDMFSIMDKLEDQRIRYTIRDNRVDWYIHGNI